MCTGERLRDVPIPEMRVTSCCFGGNDFSELFVTSGTVGFPPGYENVESPLSGSIFKVTGLGAKGYAGCTYKP